MAQYTFFACLDVYLPPTTSAKNHCNGYHFKNSRDARSGLCVTSSLILDALTDVKPLGANTKYKPSRFDEQLVSITESMCTAKSGGTSGRQANSDLECCYCCRERLGSHGAVA